MLEETYIIEVNNVSKKFSKNFKKSLIYGFIDSLYKIFGIRKKNGLRKEEFWAVKNVSFSLKKGDSLGLIGHNGAGKSTLLKMLNGLIAPDEGEIIMRGRVSALIELGAGFNPILTGRENIYINGQILGFTKKEIDAKLQDIIEFSELGEFVDAPVQNYSSGMKVRLGFAVAVQMEPDILIIDEVLAVGDMGFKLKCYNALDKMVNDVALIFVSHSMPQVSRLCSMALLMEHGSTKIVSEDVSSVIENYYGGFDVDQKDYSLSKDISINGFNIVSDELVDGIPVIESKSDLNINFKLKYPSKYKDAITTIIIYDKEQRPIGVFIDYAGLRNKKIINKSENSYLYSFSVTVPKINLSAGVYFITISISEEYRSKPVFRLQSFQKLHIRSENIIWTPIEFESKWE